ncbi:CSTF64 [Symbiodinium natans]|uniref:CSTF64 protein n=1 Tax=Symbiodinium natans TaxID=878477 RepID=A0A812TDH0_9DINO|nr:CSTF64 [Symbiodinium natans]
MTTRTDRLGDCGKKGGDFAPPEGFQLSASLQFARNMAASKIQAWIRRTPFLRVQVYTLTVTGTDDAVVRYIRGNYTYRDRDYVWANEYRSAFMYRDKTGWWRISPSAHDDSAYAMGPPGRLPPLRWFCPIKAAEVHDNIQLTPKVEQEDEYESSSSAASSESVPPTSPLAPIPDPIRDRVLFAKQQEVRAVLFNPFRQEVWPVFVGNIARDTTFEDIRELFGDIGGFVSWRLSMQTDRAEGCAGASGDFGFAEFKTPEGALEGIKKVDGVEIKGRKLRLRWAENAPTTPEVDDFYRGPERYKTRLCYEVLQGLPCPRPDNCPYAHVSSELRHPRDDEEKPEAKPIDPEDVGAKAHDLAENPLGEDRWDSLEKENDETSGVLGLHATTTAFRADMLCVACGLRGAGRAKLGETHPVTLISMDALAFLLQVQQCYEEADGSDSSKVRRARQDPA